MKLFTIIFFAVFSFYGCSFVKVDSAETTSEIYSPKKSADEVKYIETLNQNYEVIGVVTVNAERRKDIDELIPKMKREAAILGGDAITNIRAEASGLWKKTPLKKLLENANIRTNFKADVIVFKD